MLNFIVIGLMCNSLGCYWAPVETNFMVDQQSCYATAANLKSKTALYFDMACMVVPKTKAD
jgi:hypothetical protein